ncbi:protein kinase [Billgrantia sulfidoxydans]|uniref:Protein kinase n=1 Tax=Billgrantia sulfidoxydans TaxID=2733484 RepID=A0ABX7W9S4_9GAMM|nr:protein kinase [Halomonas sulfidoxydans]QTP56317.1 protein kinase [Halomonas sulfidoxydans]
MKMLWEFPEDVQKLVIESKLCKHGDLIGEMSTPHSMIYTFKGGDTNYVIAKGIKTEGAMSLVDRHSFFSQALYEVNNAHVVCHHPSIQRFFDIDIISGVPFLLSRKRDTTLRDFICEGPVSEPEALSISIQIVHALNYCEKKGLLCHQDLKPENVFLDYISKHFDAGDGYPIKMRSFVADFELANAYLVLGRPYGSRPYMAPEQYVKSLEDGSPDFSKVDVFAVGVILFEMLTGGLHPLGEETILIWPEPSEGKSPQWRRETPWKKWLKRGAKIECESDNVSQDGYEIISSCLEVDFSKRFTKEQLEARLLERLSLIDKAAYDELTGCLDYFDDIAVISESEGWPYYENRVELLNKTFADRPVS